MYRNILEEYIPKILTVVILGDGGNMGNSVVLYNYLYFLLFLFRNNYFITKIKVVLRK